MDNLSSSNIEVFDEKFKVFGFLSFRKKQGKKERQ